MAAIEQTVAMGESPQAFGNKLNLLIDDGWLITEMNGRVTGDLHRGTRVVLWAILQRDVSESEARP